MSGIKRRLTMMMVLGGIMLIPQVLARTSKGVTVNRQPSPRLVVPSTGVMRIPAGAWTKSLSVVTSNALNYTETFESTWPVSPWELYHPSTAADVDWGRVSYRHSQGQYSAWCAAAGSQAASPGADVPVNTESWMIVGPFDLSDVTGGQLSFDYWLETEEDYDEFLYGASTDNNTFSVISTSIDTSGFQSVSVDLTNFAGVDYAGEPEVYFAWIYKSDESIQYEGAYVDNLVITAQSAGSGIPAAERAALIALYNAAGGDQWTDNTGWLGAPGTEGDWAGVTLNDAGTHVVGLDLNRNNLVGEIPAEIGDLSALQILDLSGNELGGAIPADIGSLTQLEYLNLAVNYLEGTLPSSMTNMGALRHLVVFANYLEGSIPTWLSTLTGLQELDLAFNLFDGQIPSGLGSMTSLEVLDLSGNYLTGSIPTQLTGLSNLTGLHLYLNDLSGNIPTVLGNLSNLQALDLFANHFSGPVPSTLGNLRQLAFLDLGANELTGNVPTQLGNLTGLEYLYLDMNQLSGTIPSSLGNLVHLTELSLYDNRFTGTIPTTLSALHDLTILDLGYNGLSGQIPDSLGGLTNLSELYLDGN